MAILVVPFEGTEWVSGVGENFRLDNWRKLLGNVTPDIEHKQKLMVQLIPEPSNPYDKKAIALHVNGIHLGYLSGDHAAHYGPTIKKVYANGDALLAYGSIWVVRRGKELKANVAVNLPEKLSVTELVDSQVAPDQPTRSENSKVSNVISIPSIPSAQLEWSIAMIAMVFLLAVPYVGLVLSVAVLILTVIFVKVRGWRIPRPKR